MKSHKLILVTLFCAALYNQSYAQLKVGPAAGLSFSTLIGDGPMDEDENFLDSYSSTTNMYLGLDLDLPIVGVLYISPSLLYYTKGAGSDLGDFKLHYFELPLMVKVKLKQGMNFFGGPYIATLLSSDVPAGYALQDPFTGSDYGLKLGIGYDLKNGLGFNSHFSFGLKDVNSKLPYSLVSYGFDNLDINWVAAMGVHYLFGKKK